MIAEQLPLARQVDLVFKEIFGELSLLSSGVVFLQIRNNIIGKFGIKHDPIESKNGSIEKGNRGLSEQQVYAFRKMAIQSLRYKTNWTHGEIHFEFTLKNNLLLSSVQFESSYNMSNLMMNARNRY